ncbi:MAG: polysaccharide biosynthesis tyrosine autokinase [Pseudomonadota bacterium]
MLAPADPRLQPAPPGAYYGPGHYAGEPAGESPSEVLREYIRIFLKRKFLILGIIAACLAIATVYTWLQTPLYDAKLRLQIDQSAADPFEKGKVQQAGGRFVEFMRTQIELLRSRALAERTVERLKLYENTAFLKPRNVSVVASVMSLVRPPPPKRDDDVVRASRREQATDLVQRGFSVTAVPGSRLVDVRFRDPNPKLAQAIATAMANAYIAANLDKRFQANAYSKTFLDDKAKELKIRLATSEEQLLAFAQKAKILAVNEKASIAENNLSSANAALGVLISKRIESEQLYKQFEKADGNAINLPQLLTNSTIDGLRAQRNKLKAQYEENLITFKPGYPLMVKLRNSMREIDRQLAREVRTIRQSYRAAYEAARNQETEMRKRIATLRDDVQSLQRRSIRYNILKREVDTNRRLYNGLLQRLREVDIAGGVGANNIFVVDKAQVPRFPSSPRLSVALALALLLGVGAGCGLAYLMELIDDTVLTPDELEQAFNAYPMLGVVPRQDSELERQQQLSDPRSALSESYRSLATTLQFSTAGGLPKTLSVTSSLPSEGKSSVSIAIAKHFATLGMKVLIIDSDMRKPSLHTKLGLMNGPGLSSYLTGTCSPPETFLQTDTPNLIFMPSGPIPPNPADILSGPRFTSLLTVGLQVFDLIMVDGPPVMGLADATILSSFTEATVYVVAAGETRKSNVRTAMRRLELARANVIGMVLNKYDSSAAGYGYGYGGYQYYGYGVEVEKALPAAAPEGAAAHGGDGPDAASPQVAANGER